MLHPVLKIQLFTDEKCFGPGIAKLLRQVQQLHSLRAAAISMDMAYSKAWTIVRRCEEALDFPLLVSSTGGRRGGGASLTQEARDLLEAYRRYCQRLEDLSQSIFQEEFQAFL